MTQATTRNDDRPIDWREKLMQFGGTLAFLPVALTRPKCYEIPSAQIALVLNRSDKNGRLDPMDK
jgi:hypothetical protein